MNPKQKLLVVNNKVKCYPRPIRFPLGPLNGHREQMSPDLMHRLLEDNVVVEEKLDGKLASFSKFPFQFFVEDMQYRKSIPYCVPGRYAVLDVFDMRERKFLAPDARLELVKAMRCQPRHLPARLKDGLIFPAPILVSGRISLQFLPQTLNASAYAIHPESRKVMAPEGVVIKPVLAMAPDEYVSGMLLASEFSFGGEQAKVPASFKLNEIDPTVGWYFADVTQIRPFDI